MLITKSFQFIQNDPLRRYQSQPLILYEKIYLSEFIHSLHITLLIQFSLTEAPKWMKCKGGKTLLECTVHLSCDKYICVYIYMFTLYPLRGCASKSSSIRYISGCTYHKYLRFQKLSQILTKKGRLKISRSALQKRSDKISCSGGLEMCPGAEYFLVALQKVEAPFTFQEGGS